MRIAVTGATGFLGWHARCALRARGGAEVTTVDRLAWGDPDLLDVAVQGADVVLHLAGANRADPGELRESNARLARRLLVIARRAELALRRLFDDRVVRFEVSGNDSAIVDMPTVRAHNIANTGDGELLTLLWAHELVEPAAPDTYPEPVAVPAEVGCG